MYKFAITKITRRNALYRRDASRIAAQGHCPNPAIELGSREVARAFQFVAMALIAVVLVGSQCKALCAIGSCEKPTQSKQATGQHKSCHQDQTPSHGSCSHVEMGAENVSSSSFFGQLSSELFTSGVTYAEVSPLSTISPVTLHRQPIPVSNQRGLSSILRI